MQGNRVLFLSHEASQTGAPALLLGLLQWLKSNCDIDIDIINIRGGLLEQQFAEIGRSYTLYDKRVFSNNTTTGIYNYIASRIMTYYRLLLMKGYLKRHRPSLIYSNTTTNGRILKNLSYLNCPVITHVHEMGDAIHRLGYGSFRHVVKNTNHYIADSNAVKANLVLNHAIGPDLISVIHGFLPPSSLVLTNTVRSRVQILKSLSLPEDALIVGACGTVQRHKGPDLFVQLGNHLVNRFPDSPVYLVWVGSIVDQGLFREISADIDSLGLGEKVRFVGLQPNPLEFFSAIDVFAMISREDSFPLVALEAATMSKPVVCFQGSGGTEEFVEDDCGFVAPYLDVETMADRVAELLRSVELRTRLGGHARRKVFARHCVEVVGPKILAVMREFL